MCAWLYKYLIHPILPQVSSNGLFSFGSAYNGWITHTFSQDSSRDYVVAPFWSDIDLRIAGSVLFQDFTTGEAQLDTVSQFIRAQMKNSFSGTWMLVAYWDSVPEYYPDPRVFLDIVSGMLYITHSYT